MNDSTDQQFEAIVAANGPLPAPEPTILQDALAVSWTIVKTLGMILRFFIINLLISAPLVLVLVGFNALLGQVVGPIAYVVLLGFVLAVGIGVQFRRANRRVQRGIDAALAERRLP